MHLPMNSVKIIDENGKEKIVHYGTTKEESDAYLAEQRAIIDDPNRSEAEKFEAAGKSIDERFFAEQGWYSAESRNEYQKFREEFMTKGRAYVPPGRRKEYRRNKIIGWGLSLTTILSGTGYALTQDPNYFGNNAGGVLTSIGLGLSLDAVRFGGAMAGHIVGAAFALREQDKSRSTQMGYRRVGAIIGMTTAMYCLSDNVYEQFKEWREPYKENVKETTYKPSSIRAEKIAAAIPFPTKTVFKPL